MSLFTSNIPMIMNHYSIMKDVSAQNLDLSQNMNVSGFSIIGGTLDVSGITTIKSLLNANGGIACDTNSFSVADSTGNTSIGGTLNVTGITTISNVLNANGGIACDTNSFSVEDSTGNTSIGGTLNVTGITTISNVLNANGGIACDTNSFSVEDSTGNTSIGGTLNVTGITTISNVLNANGGITCDTDNFIVSGTNGDTSIKGKLSVGATNICTDVGLNNQTLANTNEKSMIFGRNNNFIGSGASNQWRIIFGYANDISGNSDENIIIGMSNKINNADGATICGRNCVVNNANSCALGVGAISTASFQTIIGSTDYSQALRLEGGLGYINSDNLIVTTNASGVTNISGLVSVNSSVSTQKAYRTYLSDAETFYVQMNGEIWAQVVTTYSDSRIKHNQEPLHGLEVIRTLKPTKYNKTNTQENNDSFEEAGFIAQEVLDTNIGWVVHTSNTQEQYYGLNYNSIFTYGIQAIKELDEQLHMEKEKTKQLQQQLQKTNEELQKTNKELQKTNEELQKTNEELQKSIFEIQYIKNMLEIV